MSVRQQFQHKAELLLQYLRACGEHSFGGFGCFASDGSGNLRMLRCVKAYGIFFCFGTQLVTLSDR